MQHAMAALRTDRTSFVIEQGNHEVLMGQRGALYNLSMSQFAGGEPTGESSVT